MDIENSPGAPLRPRNAVARDDWGHAAGSSAGGDGKMNWNCLCRIRHPATVGGKHAGHRHFTGAKGVLWRHASVNLVQPRTLHLAAARILQRAPKIKLRLASAKRRRNRTAPFCLGIRG